MRNNLWLGVSSFLVSLALLGGIWAAIQVDTSARSVGFSGLSSDASLNLQLPTPALQTADFLLEHPQLLPAWLRLGVYGVANLRANSMVQH